MPISAKTLPKTEAADSPSEAIVKERNPVHTVVDELGRTIRYRYLSVLERARICRALGEHASNTEYAGLIGYAAIVLDIDGDSGPPKTTLAHLEHRLEWLRDEGYAAILKDHVERAVAEQEAEASEASDPKSNP